MALIYVWLRLSTMKQLDWHRGSSYLSKDIAHVQKTIAQRMADKARAGLQLCIHFTVCHIANWLFVALLVRKRALLCIVHSVGGIGSNEVGSHTSAGWMSIAAEILKFLPSADQSVREHSFQNNFRCIGSKTGICLIRGC